MNGTSDYKFGQIEQKVEDMSTDIKEWKDNNRCQHEAIMEQIETVRLDVRSLMQNVTALQVKAGFIGALAGIGGAVISFLAKTLF